MRWEDGGHWPRGTVFRYADGELRFWAQFVVALSAVLVFGAVLLGTVGAIVNTVGRHYSHVNCTKYAVANDRPTKWVSYTWWSYDCLTPTRDGKWISIKQLRAVAK